MRWSISAVTFVVLVAVIHTSKSQSSFPAEDALDSIQKCFPDNTLPTLDPQNVPKLSRNQQAFTLSLIKKIYQKHRTSNIFFSPHSVYQALLLSLFISGNHTEYNIKRALHLPTELTKASIIQAFKVEDEVNRIRSLNGTVSYEFSTANTLFVSQKLHLRDCMLQLFQNEVFPVDYAKDPAGALRLINGWVSEKTKNQINDLLSANDVTEDSKLILTNAAYFKGLWQSKFSAENTRKEVFFLSTSKNALVNMMRQKGNFKHFVSEKLGAHILQMPYKGNDISMYILLPPFISGNDGIQYMLSKLTPEVLEELIDGGFMVERSVEVLVPKFTVEQELKLVPILEELGVGDLFQRTADLSALTGHKDVTFNEAIHKAKVSIDEDGTIAAAATAFYSFRSSRPLEPIKFNCNHPFVYFIYDNISQTVLFIGIYNSPLY